MPKFSSYKPGQFCWVDLNSTDQDKAEAFYKSLFGWDSKHEEIPGGAHYVTFTKAGASMAGVGQMSDEMKKMGVPSVWCSYINVEDCDATVDKAVKAGAQVEAPAMDVMDAGRMAFVKDPTGASVGFWQKKNHFGAGIASEPDAFSWNELATRDIEGAKKFYSKVFGWEYRDHDTPMGPYAEIMLGAGENGAMMTMPPNVPEQVPPYWNVYFRVEDVDAKVKELKKLGGEVIMDAMDIPQGRLAAVQDSTGGSFTLFRKNE